MFAYGSYANACVIDVGYQKTEVTPIVDYQVFVPGSKVLDLGGQFINERLARLLPDLTPAQIETLKKSSIFESLSAEDAKNSFFGTDALAEKNADEDGVFDVAAIVTSDKSTREILAEQEKQKKGKKQAKKVKQNSELERNKFVDDDGYVIEVGKERFQGSAELIDSIARTVYKSLLHVTDPKRRQECYDALSDLNLKKTKV
ncbi:unnamed protein product [Ambrosiozyma monospora]|uniref:Unnamed protein product n=1 Tax=Ambrosiozyma monospora TaxID=43982 RepID=A0ACB5UA45_AMBMO|nr:unnamed protein product [Ambrosiozyma monospora]